MIKRTRKLRRGSRQHPILIQDKTYPKLYRVDCGSFITDLVNITRAKDFIRIVQEQEKEKDLWVKQTYHHR